MAAFVIVIQKGELPEQNSPDSSLAPIPQQAIEAAHSFTEKRYSNMGKITFIGDSIVDRSYGSFCFDVYESVKIAGKDYLIKVCVREFLWEKEQYRWIPDTIFIVN